VSFGLAKPSGAFSPERPASKSSTYVSALPTHVVAQAGSRPLSVRWTHIVHFSTFRVASFHWGAPYGQAQTQYLQPMHFSWSMSTTPSDERFEIASTGQAFMHAGVRQWLHADVTKVRQKLG
jgi:hypothetical protein